MKIRLADKYRDAVNAILVHQNFFTAQSTVSAWHAGTVPPWFDTARAAKHIEVALKTFVRIHRMTDKEA